MVNARQAVINSFSKTSVENVRPKPENFSFLEETLRITGLLQEIHEKPFLFGIVKDVISAKNKDADTIIYRIAMALYHSQSLSGVPAFKSLEDPALLYLKISQNKDFMLKYDNIIQRFSTLGTEQRVLAFKTFMSFVLSAYLYYSVSSNNS
jgi:hypothetical protein